MKPQRPAGVKFLTLLLLVLAFWNLLRAVEAVLLWKALAEYHARGGPLYLAVSGGTWAVVSFVVGWVSWQGKPWAWGAALGLVAGFGSWAWYDRLVMQTALTNQPFALAVTIFLLAVVCITLFSKNVRKFFHER